MSLTLPEICEKLQRVEETILLELLDINSEDIIERFQDKIEAKADAIEGELE